MTLRTAALHDRDPRELQTGAELLALRGVHPSVETAQAALLKVRQAGTERPTEQRSLRERDDRGHALSRSPLPQLGVNDGAFGRR